MPLPAVGFEASETGVPWRAITRAGHRIVFSTPSGKPARADEGTVSGDGLGLFGKVTRAEKPALAAYREMLRDSSFLSPLPWNDIAVDDYDALVIPGGHHPGMREYLESSVLQAAVSRFFEQEKLVSAICHGVVLIARSKAANGKSVLHGRRTTTVPGVLENLVWRMTHKRMGRHYGRPYDETAEDEIRRCMARPKDLVITAPPVRKDAPGKEHRGFCLVDGNYISGRLPHDVHCFGKTVADALTARARR